jgi:hypothetical protein
MTVTANKKIAVGWRTCIRVMLAQTGSPSRPKRPESVGIFYTAMTAHTGNGVDTVLSGVGTADVYLIAGCSRAVVTVDATGPTTCVGDIHINRVGIVETDSPGKALSRRRVAVVIPEAGVTLGAPSLVVRIV